MALTKPTATGESWALARGIWLWHAAGQAAAKPQKRSTRSTRSLRSIRQDLMMQNLWAVRLRGPHPPPGWWSWYCCQLPAACCLVAWRLMQQLSNGCQKQTLIMIDMVRHWIAPKLATFVKRLTCKLSAPLCIKDSISPSMQDCIASPRLAKTRQDETR